MIHFKSVRMVYGVNYEMNEKLRAWLNRAYIHDKLVFHLSFANTYPVWILLVFNKTL